MKLMDDKFRDAMSFGDVHEDGKNTDLDNKLKLIATIGREKPELLVVAGDVLDRWKCSWDDLVGTEFFQALRTLISNRSNTCLMTVVIPKNHDHGLPKDLFKDYMNEYYYYESNNLVARVGEHTYKWMHGWEYDVTWGGIGKIPGVYPLAFFLAEHAPWLMIPLYRRLFGGEKESPGTLRKEIEIDLSYMAFHTVKSNLDKQFDRTFEADLEKWNWHVALIHDRARADVKKDRIFRILQHTHYPWAFDGLICDGGGFLWDHTFVHVTDWPRLRKVDEE